MSTPDSRPDPERVRERVRDGYSEVARDAQGRCGPSRSRGSGEFSRSIGYSSEELAALPDGANVGAGCGNPTAAAEISPGETVLDLGSGAGIDCFLAARLVGPRGRVIGVDMTEEMVRKARGNAARVSASNVEFRQGLIENLPVDDESIDLVISNCVINLSPEKERVFGEAYRVLRPGGRMLVSDIVLERDLPEDVADHVGAYVGCIAGAIRRDAYQRMVREAGFVGVEVLSATSYGVRSGSEDERILAEATGRMGVDWQVIRDHVGDVTSLKLRAEKPRRRSGRQEIRTDA